MSSDENKIMPTLEAVLERINQVAGALGEFRQSVEARLDKMEADAAKAPVSIPLCKPIAPLIAEAAGRVLRISGVQ